MTDDETSFGEAVANAVRNTVVGRDIGFCDPVDFDCVTGSARFNLFIWGRSVTVIVLPRVEI